MTDRMDAVILAAVRQGFAVRQTRTGSWVFTRRGITVIARRTPESATEWMYLINSLRGAGLALPPRE
ncbi:hypothetical protein J2S43_007871 [Catenuloplanes nepalensis]|uniref:Uncharacterized protein n=1 Tax=Catenuloplanes nepalensis TaxID=587533 RepID=A0ABT9N6N8_9ACTN|nr:hypothetical protein [Catenuloplanes nepalensis]MDP9799359.1 hypothetical protein [Catenuloplanes nepalensis]